MATHKPDHITSLTCTTDPTNNPPIRSQSWSPGGDGIDPFFEIDGVISLPPGSITGGQIDWDGAMGTAQVVLGAADFVAAADGKTMFSFASPGIGGAGQKWSELKLAFYGATGAGAPPASFVLELWGEPPGGGS